MDKPRRIYRFEISSQELEALREGDNIIPMNCKVEVRASVWSRMEEFPEQLRRDLQDRTANLIDLEESTQEGLPHFQESQPEGQLVQATLLPSGDIEVIEEVQIKQEAPARPTQARIREILQAYKRRRESSESQVVEMKEGMKDTRRTGRIQGLRTDTRRKEGYKKKERYKKEKRIQVSRKDTRREGG